MKRIAYLIPLILIAFIGLAVSRSNAQQNTTWTIEYFNNHFLSSPTANIQTFNTLSLNWGSSAPAANVNADNFSARIATDTYFPAGTYRFYLMSDDRAHLYVDFQSKINNWDNPVIGELRQVDVTLPAGTFHIQVDYLEEAGNAYVYLDWENIADGIQGPNFTTATTSGVWTAQYYSNLGLTGTPFATFNEASPSHNWGFNAPITGMPADNFSARWVTTQYFDGSPYTMTVTADDGIRVYLDNIAYIDEWHLADARTYTFTVTPSAGNHTLKIEFYEAAGVASLNFNLARSGGTTPTQPGNTGSYLVVDTGRLNVRNLPTVNGSNVLTKISLGETYPIVGRNAQSTWWQINVNGLVGWVSSPYVDAFNTSAVPITSGSPVTNNPATQYRITAIANVNMRSGPSIAFDRVSILPNSVSVNVIGRNASSTWWYINYNGVNGWVSAAFAPIQAGANILTIPILG